MDFNTRGRDRGRDHAATRTGASRDASLVLEDGGSRVQPGSDDQTATRAHQVPASPALATSQVRSRDWAERSESTTPTQQRVKSPVFSFGPARLRHRVGSVNTSVRPSPSFTHLGRNHNGSVRGSIAFAATSARDNDTASRKFSIAGPSPVEALAANQPYVDPGYAQLNPAYDQPANVRPVWSLAKPLPRVLRPGMVPAEDEIQKEMVEEERHEREQEQTNQDHAHVPVDLESGRIEPTLRPDKIVSQLDSIRRERELSLFRAYKHQYHHYDSPGMSPFGPQRDSPSTIGGAIDSRSRRDNRIEEELEGSLHSQQDIPHLELPRPTHPTEAVDQAREKADLKLSYQDAVPLLAYEAEDDEVHNLHTYWSIVRLRFREPLAELLAITVQFTLGFSVNLSAALSTGGGSNNGNGDWAWGLATMVAIYIAGGISGAHLNPAMSLMLYIYRGFPLRKVPVYVAAQMLGAFMAALIAFGLFQPGLVALHSQSHSPSHSPSHSQQQQILQLSTPDLGPSTSISISSPLILSNFITSPRAPWVTTGTAFLTELTGTSILAVAILALGDDANAPPGAGMNAFIVGLLVATLSMAFGSITGLAMNPVRDFGPRVAMAALGFPGLFTDGYWFRVAWLGPLAGAVLGGFLYDAAIFVGGESPVNYPTERIRRATRKWHNRWRARIKRTKRVVEDVKDGVVRSGYEVIEGQ